MVMLTAGMMLQGDINGSFTQIHMSSTYISMVIGLHMTHLALALIASYRAYNMHIQLKIPKTRRAMIDDFEAAFSRAPTAYFVTDAEDANQKIDISDAPRATKRAYCIRFMHGLKDALSTIRENDYPTFYQVAQSKWRAYRSTHLPGLEHDVLIELFEWVVIDFLFDIDNLALRSEMWDLDSKAFFLKWTPGYVHVSHNVTGEAAFRLRTALLPNKI